MLLIIYHETIFHITYTVCLCFCCLLLLQTYEISCNNHQLCSLYCNDLFLYSELVLQLAFVLTQFPQRIKMEQKFERTEFCVFKTNQFPCR